MSNPLPQIVLARHGETTWSLSGQHTGRTDIPLTPQGEVNARKLIKSLEKFSFAKVFTSPLQRAEQTCNLAGFGNKAEKMADLMEWDYGEYEGKTSGQIHQLRPDWLLFRDGCPGGESPLQVGNRADRIVEKIRAISGNVLLFAHGHILRVLAARWLGLPPQSGRYFLLSTGAVSILSYEHNVEEPALGLWNDTSHLD